MLTPPTPPPPVEDSDSDDKEDSDSDSQQHVPVAVASAQPKRKIIEPSNAVETNPDKRRAFSDFISSSLKDIDERLWDTYTQEALKLVIDFKRRSRAAPTVPGAPVAGDDQ